MIINILYILFILACLFDPANVIVGIKLPLFVIIFIITVLLKNKPIVPKFVLRYIILFSLLLPVVSVMWGWCFNSSNYRNETIIEIIKPYLFIFMSLSLINSPSINICKVFSRCLLLLAFIIILIFILYTGGFVPFGYLYNLGNGFGLFTIGERSFGGMTIDRVYFHTSPMLIFGSFYYLYLNVSCKKTKYLIYSIIISISLFVSGSRNDMIMAFVPYVTYGYLNASHKIKIMLITLFSLFVIYLLSSEMLANLFDLSEKSNAEKIGYLSVYLQFYCNPITLIMGDGLGSYAYFPDDGYLNNTELTYLELIRRFGIFGTMAYLFLMFKPVFSLYEIPHYRWLAFALLMYLLMIITNPFFFSSNGMLILSIVLSSIYSSRCVYKKTYEY